MVGFFREVLIGFHFGTSQEADSVIAAYTIPNFIYLAAGGAITTAFISIYTKTERKEGKAFRQVIFTYAFFIFSFISILFLLFPDFWIGITFRGLDTEEKRLTTDLFRLMGLSTLFLVLSMFFTGILNAHERFRTSSLAPLFYNIMFVGIAAAFYPLVGIEAYSYGALIGAFGMFMLLFISLRRGDNLSLHFQWTLKKVGHVKRFLLIAIPVLFGGATLQFYFLIHRIFASQLGDGAIAALNYSSKFVQLPQSILMTAVTTVIYPLIAKTIVEKDESKLNAILNRGLSNLVFIMIPVTVYVYLYAEEIIRLLFEYGNFNENSTILTSKLLKILVIGMLAHSGNLYLTRFFYAMERAAAPVLTGLIAVFGVNVVISITFIGLYGENAIAWATTISAYSQMIMLLFLLVFRLKLKLTNFVEYVKYSVLCVIILAVGSLMKPVFHLIPLDVFRIVASGVFFVCIFFLVAYVLKVQELKVFLKTLKK
jgi:putative peptidoglycan lipid II flippase